MKAAGFSLANILQNQSQQNTLYTGVTEDLCSRLAKHHSGEVLHTAKFRRWRIKTALVFTDGKTWRSVRTMPQGCIRSSFRQRATVNRASSKSTTYTAFD
jgi:hypothetical protein